MGKLTAIVHWMRAHRLQAVMLAFTLSFYSVLLVTARKGPEERAADRAQRSAFREELREKERLFSENLGSRPDLARAAGFALALVLAAGLTMDMAIGVRKLTRRPLLEAQEPPHKAGWGPVEVVNLFVFLFFFEAVILAVQSFVQAEESFLLLNTFARDAAAVLMLFYIVRVRYRQPLAALGLSLRSWAGNVLKGLAGYLALIPALFVMLVLVAAAARWFGHEPPPQPVVEIYLQESRRPHLALITLFVAVAGPMIEEVFFRGFTYGAFRGRFGARRAMIYSAALFAALHMDPVAVLPVFVLGLFLAYLYEKTGTLAAPMGVHVTHNLIMVFFTLTFKSLSA